MPAEIFRFPRRRPVLIFCLAAVFALGVFVNPTSLSGLLLLFSLVFAVAAVGVFDWRYAVIVGQTSIEVGSFARRLYKLSNIRAISVRRVKGGRTGAIEFDGQVTLFLEGDLEHFDELLALISSRTSLPITKPVWDP